MYCDQKQTTIVYECTYIIMLVTSHMQKLNHKAKNVLLEI